jgi:hypothetical protein
MAMDATPALDLAPPSAPERWRAILRAGRQEAESMAGEGDEATRQLWALLRPLPGLPAVH